MTEAINPIEPSKEEIEALKSEHGEVQQVDIPELHMAFVLTTPSRAQYKRWEDKVSQKGKMGFANENLVIDICVWPSRDELNDRMTRKPGIVSTLAAEALKLAGLSEDASVKKL